MTGELNNAEPISGGNSWQPEMLRAMTVAIRTHAYERCGEVFINGHRGINGQITQEYRYAPVIPDTIYNVSQQTLQDFQNATSFTQGNYLKYGK